MAIIDSKKASKQAVPTYSWSSIFAKLLTHKPHFDIVADAKTTLFWQAKLLGVSDQIKILPTPIKKKNYYLTASKQSKNIRNPQAFLHKADRCLKRLKYSGKYQEILKKYGAK